MSELMLTPVFSVSEQRVIRRAMRLLFMAGAFAFIRTKDYANRS